MSSLVDKDEKGGGGGRGERETALFPRLKKNLFISTRKFSWRKQAFAAREFLYEQKH